MSRLPVSGSDTGTWGTVLNTFLGDNLPISVKSDTYAGGAKGDGVTDDTAAIQAAIDAAHTAGGGTVYFPRGTYLCNSIVQKTATANITLAGAGRGASVIAKNAAVFASDSALVLFRDSTNITVRDLTLVGRTSGTTTVNVGDTGLDFSACTNVNVFDNGFKDLGDAALRVRTDTLGITPPAATDVETFRVIVSGNFFENVTQTSCTPGGAQSYIFTNNVFSNLKWSAKFAGRFAAHGRLEVTDNIIVNSTDATLTSRVGIEVVTATTVLISNNIIINPVIGISIYSNESDTVTAIAWTDLLLANNVITNVVRGIRVGNEPHPIDSTLLLCERAAVRNNHIACSGGSDTSVHHGLTFVGAFRDVVIADNNITSPFGSGVYAEIVGLTSLSSTDNIDIQRNTIRSAGAEAILIKRRTSPTPDRLLNRLRVESNTIRDGKAALLKEIDGLVCNNNVVEGATVGIALNTIDNLTFTKNRVISTTTTAYALDCVDVDIGRVENNELVGGATASYAVSFDTACSLIRESGNYISGALVTNNKTVPSQRNMLVEDLIQPANAYTVPRGVGIVGSATPTAGTIYASLLRTRKSGVATGVNLFCSTSFAGATDFRVALYSFDLATKHGESANMGNPAATAIISCPFAGGTYTYTEESWYWVIIGTVGTTAGVLRGLNFTSSAFVSTANGAAIGQSKTGYAGGALATPMTGLNPVSFVWLAELY